VILDASPLLMAAVRALLQKEHGDEASESFPPLKFSTAR
jgi:hypothetical protein